MARKVKKSEIEQEFREHVLPGIKAKFEQDGRADYDARSQAWNDFTDLLCKDGRITDHQYRTWACPSCCNERKRRR